MAGNPNPIISVQNSLPLTVWLGMRHFSEVVLEREGLSELVMEPPAVVFQMQTDSVRA